MKLLWVFIGGGSGACIRYLLTLLGSSLNLKFLATMGINVLGSFLIGIVWMWAQAKGLRPELSTLVIAGFLGGFTTYSTFSLEASNLLRNGDFANASLYIIGTVVLCIGACLFSLWLTSGLIRH